MAGQGAGDRHTRTSTGPRSEGQGFLLHFLSWHKNQSRSTLGLSLSCLSHVPKAKGALRHLRPVPAAGNRTGGAAWLRVPWERPAEHRMGQPSVRNEERPLFTVTNGRGKKIKIL